MAFDFNIGDKVRYREDGSTSQMRGIEGVITGVYNTSASMDITKLNHSKVWVRGQEIYPDLDNLELIVEGTLPAQATANTITNFSIGGTDLVEAVEHPAHYGGDTTYEVIKVAEAWGLDKDAYLFNVLKYIARGGKKADNPVLQDLQKGLFYYQRRIKQLEEELANSK